MTRKPGWDSSYQGLPTIIGLGTTDGELKAAKERQSAPASRMSDAEFEQGMREMEREASAKSPRGEMTVKQNPDYYRNQNVLDSQAAQARHEQGSNQYWPSYNPTTGEDLSDKLRQALEANHQQVLIFTPEDAAQTLKSLWEEKGTDSLTLMNKIRGVGDNGYTIYKTIEMVKQFGDLGVVAKSFTSKGKDYMSIAARDNSGKMLKHVLVNGVRLKINHNYRINNPKLVQLALTPQSRGAVFKGAAVITFVISASINTNDLIFKDDYHMVDWFGNVGVDMFKALVSFGAGELAILVLAGTFGGMAILAGVVIAIAVSVVIDIAFGEWKVSEQVVGGLKDFGR